MSELVWGIKNGDLDIVKDFVESKVSFILDLVFSQATWNSVDHVDLLSFTDLLENWLLAFGIK